MPVSKPRSPMEAGFLLWGGVFGAARYDRDRARVPRRAAGGGAT
ncbi:hypothetical protein Y601_5946 [Burkholderia pseudomallei MSHR640]|nr:hypothetical protein Y601_5946 [Burkholderia pseudomallei MSHR640]